VIIWFVIGIVVYFLYGVRRSNDRSAALRANEKVKSAYLGAS
jgi:heme/copper-type cytochrome/quinol oxidase subunit 2